MTHVNVMPKAMPPLPLMFLVVGVLAATAVGSQTHAKSPSRSTPPSHHDSPFDAWDRIENWTSRGVGLMRVDGRKAIVPSDLPKAA